jgi:hypothetical protein
VNARLFPGPARPRWIAIGALLALVGVELIWLLIDTGGHLIYSLDDPYIHLELARNLAHGLYGLNPGEPASPSSSAIWPLLLVPLARLPIGDLVPFALNLAAAVASLLLIECALVLTIGPERSARHQPLIVLLATLLIVGTNLVGLIFTGMEHSLQVLLALLALRGLISVVRGQGLPRWLVPALVLGPLVRYENIAISGPALLLLFASGHRRPALAGGAAMALTLGAFSLFLVGLGLDPLPTSVQLKTTAFVSVPVLPGLDIRTSIFTTLRTPGGALLFIVLCVLAARALRPGRREAERGLAATLALSIALHLFGGRIGWFWRYELYVLVLGLVGALYLYRAPIRWLLDNRSKLWSGMTLCLCVLPAVVLYAPALVRTPLSAGDVYRQQYQLHRFLAEYYRGPAALNDIGWASYRNDEYVLDLYGLASAEARRLRAESRDAAWMQSLAARHGIGLAMIYPNWFRSLPDDWQPVGTLVSTNNGAFLGGRRVTFYATSPEAAAPIRAALERFATTLPPGDSLELAPIARS